MKNRLLRAFLSFVALVLLLQVGAFSAAAATPEEIAQYESDLALYHRWKAYDEQEAAYYAYQEYLTNGVHQHEAYLQYQAVISQIETKLENLDYIFIQDKRGWALIESIDLGVGAVEQFASNPENMSKYEDLIGELSSVLTKAKYSSEALKEMFETYRGIAYASYASEKDRLEACYAFYKSHYNSLISNSNELYKDLYSFYALSNVVIRNAVDKKEKEKNMQGRYLRLVAQLAVLSYCLDDEKNLPDPNATMFNEIISSLNLLLESSQIMTDSNDANPSETFPTEEIKDVSPVDPVEKPTKPTGTKIEVEPIAPAGYVHVHSWDAGRETKPATQAAEGIMTYTCTTCFLTKTEAIPKLSPSGGGGGGESGGGGGGGVVIEEPPQPEVPEENLPVKLLNSASASKSDLLKSVSGKYANGVTNEGAQGEVPSASADALLKAGVTAVALQVQSNEKGELLSFEAKGGKPDTSTAYFDLLLTEGGDEDYRYVYFRPEEDGSGELLSGDRVSVSLSDEVLRCKSFYLRPSEEVDDENCNLKSLPISALPGEAVQINPQCTFGYEIVNLVVRTKDGEEILVDRMEFVMPYGPVTLSFEVVKILYHVQFFVDGVLVAERDYGLGEEIVPPELETTPVKESDGEYNYTFIGWETVQKTAVGDERELKAEARFAKTAIHNGEEFYDLRWAFLKPILLVGGAFAALALALFFLIRHRGKKKKRS